MGLVFKPHTASVETATQKVAGGDVGGANFAAAVNVGCQITPGKASVAYDTFGIEVNRPYLLMADAEDAPKFTAGTKVTWSGKVLKVLAAETYGALTIGSHVSVLLKENELS